MSKKSRKRNKKILAAIGIGLGAAALASKKRNASIADNEANESGFAASNKKASIADVSGPVKKDTSKSDVAPVAEKVSVPVGKMRGAGTDESAIAGQKKRADYAKNSRINAVNTSEGPPSIDNPYNSRVIKGGRLGTVNYRKDGGRAKLKSGGSARGAGCAKRGVSKILLKGKR